MDDGLATGATMRAAVSAARRLGPARVIVAVPVAPPETARFFEQQADEFISLLQPETFGAIGMWYAQFPQLSDDEVRELLAGAAAAKPGQGVDKSMSESPGSS